MTDHLLEPLRGLIDLSTLDRRPVIELGKGELINAQKNYSIPTVIAHPGSSSPSKSWSLERFIQWAQLLKKANIEVGFIYGPIERERGIVLPSNLPHFSPPDLRTLATILAQTQLFVGNDSGPGHIAAAVGTPTLSLFGSTNPTLWAPRHETNRVLMAPQGDVQKLSVESVLKATINALETAR